MKSSMLITLLFLATQTFANVAMPGFFGIGGTSDFQLLFPEDSIHMGKIRMNREWISIQLYPGFAVVKGEYEMQNLTAESATLKVGYPVNTMYESSGNIPAYGVQFDSLYALTVKINGVTVSTEGMDKPVEDNGYRSFPNWNELNRQTRNWLVWETTFSPGQPTMITVYFIVSTNGGQVIQGYNKDYSNGFAYLLESGNPWAGTIGTGRILVQDMGKKRDWHGVMPFERFKLSPDESNLIWDFKELEPDSSDNVIVRYGQRVGEYDENTIPENAQPYFQSIDQSGIKEMNLQGWDTADFQNMFETKSKAGGLLVGGAMMLVIYGIPLLGIILAILLVVFLLKYLRKKKRENNA